MKIASIVLLVSSLLAEDMMVERMQSVVDEVTELRSRYESSARNNEACQKQVREQALIIEKASKSEGLDYKVFEENRKRLAVLEQENSALKKRLQAHSEKKEKSKESLALENEIEALREENSRLNTSANILMGKNHSLLDQLNTLKRSDGKQEELSILKEELLSVNEKLIASQALERELEQKLKSSDTHALEVSKLQDAHEKERYLILSKKNKGLEKELQASQLKIAALDKKCVSKTITKVKKVIKLKESKSVCLDDNPFPDLMMKEEKETAAQVKPRLLDKQEVPNNLEESTSEDAQEVVLQEGRTYRLKQESAIYQAPDGKVIATWEAHTSFTSNIYKGEWIKITGYFVNMKWMKSTEEMWIKAKETVER